MASFDRSTVVRTLAALVIAPVTAFLRRLAIACISIVVVLAVLAFTVGPAAAVSLVDWELLGRVLVLVGKLVVTAPARALVT